MEESNTIGIEIHANELNHSPKIPFIARLPPIITDNDLNKKEYEFELMSNEKLSEAFYANCSLEELQKMYITSNSPMISHHNSDNDSDSEHSYRKTKIGEYKKLTYNEVEKSLDKYYSNKETLIVNIDMLSTFIRGQRQLTIYAKNMCFFKWGFVLALSFSLSSFVAVFMPFAYSDRNTPVISGPSAVVSILLLLLAFGKFETSGAVFNLKTKHFEYIESIINFNAQLVENKDRLKEVFDNVETKYVEMGNMYSNDIPAYVINMFPLIYHTNIFTFIKKTELYRKNLIIKFRNIKNEIGHILHKWAHQDHIENIHNIDETLLSSQVLKEKKRLTYLIELKEVTKRELMNYNSIFVQLNDLFVQEIKYANANKYWFLLSRLFFKPDYNNIKLNPVLRDYILLISPI